MIDAHVHLIQPSRWRYAWLEPGSPLDRNVSVSDLRDDMGEHDLDGGVLIEATNTPDEIPWLLARASLLPGAWGVIGWSDLDLPHAPDRIAAWSRDPRFCGVRLNWLVPRPNIDTLTPALKTLAACERVVDILPDWSCRDEIAACIQAYPDLTFIVEHWGGVMTSGNIVGWLIGIAPIAALPNAALKLSGYSADVVVLRAFLDAAIGLFGIDRVIYGSNFPVQRGGADLMLHAAEHLDTGAHAALFGENARRLYRL